MEEPIDPCPAAGDAEVYDPDTLADLAEMFGSERLAHLLAGLDEEIVQRLAAATAQDKRLGENAHALVSVSGTLGFMALSRACVALERASLDGTDLAEPLRAARAEAARARQAIVTLRPVQPHRS